MADYQQLIDNIQSVLSSELSVGEEVLAGLNSQLTDATAEVNERLNFCCGLLRDGHRAEAIRQAETEPNLLAAATALDFLEREYWDAFVRQCGLPCPPSLAIEAALDLNEAYSAEQPLEHLMRNHRLRALARDSLGARISTMRKIWKLDPDNPIWEKDIREFEKARLNQLASEVDAVVQREDVQALQMLEQEVCSEDWLEKPPKHLVDRTAQLHGQLRAKLARAALEKIEPKLMEAYSEFDVDLGRKLRERWNSRVVIAQVRADDPMLERVAPALEWLVKMDSQSQHEQEYHAALAALEYALDEGCTQEELERAYHNVARHEMGMSEVLKRRVAERVRALQVTSARRNILILVGLILVTLLVAGAVGLGITRHMRNEEVATTIMNGRGLLEDGKLAECEGYVEKMETTKPYITDNSEFQKLVEELKAAIEKEDGRKARLAQYMAAARTAGVENPRWESFQTALAELEDADRIAVSDAEKADVLRLRGQITAKRNEMQDEVDKAFETDVNELLGRFEKLDQEDVAAIDGLIREAKTLENRARVTSGLKNPLAPLVARLGALREGILTTEREAQLLHRVTHAVGNLDGFTHALESYVEAFPSTGRANSFEKVAKNEVPLWAGVEQWRGLMQRWPVKDWSLLAPDRAKTFMDEVEKMRADHGDCPEPANLEPLLSYLGVVTNRVDADGNKIHLTLREVFDNWVNKVNMVEAKDGKRYYFREDPIPNREGLIFYYIPAFDPADTVRVKLEMTDIANPATRQGSFDWTSPQMPFREFALSQLDGLGDHNWERTFCAILKGLDNSQKIDAILRLQLLEHVLAVGCEGSYCMEKAFEKYIERLEVAGGSVDVAWLDPNDEAVNEARKNAEQTLSELGDMDEEIAATAQLLKQMSQLSLGRSYTWIGWLCEKGPEEWDCLTRPGVQKTSGELFVLHVGRGGPAQFTKIGSSQGGRYVVNTPAKEALIEGRAVFFVKAESSTP